MNSENKPGDISGFYLFMMEVRPGSPNAIYDNRKRGSLILENNLFARAPRTNLIYNICEQNTPYAVHISKTTLENVIFDIQYIITKRPSPYVCVYTHTHTYIHSAVNKMAFDKRSKWKSVLLKRKHPHIISSEKQGYFKLKTCNGNKSWENAPRVVLVNRWKLARFKEKYRSQKWNFLFPPQTGTFFK